MSPVQRLGAAYFETMGDADHMSDALGVQLAIASLRMSSSNLGFALGAPPNLAASLNEISNCLGFETATMEGKMPGSRNRFQVTDGVIQGVLIPMVNNEPHGQ